MSSPVKPPGTPGTGGVEAPEVAAPNAEQAAKGVDRAASEAFASSMQRASELPAKGDVSTTDRAALLRSLAEQIRSGSIDAATAVDRLVQRSMGGAMVSALPAAQRARLEEMLRTLVANDPTLQAMQKDLSRGG